MLLSSLIGVGILDTQLTSVSWSGRGPSRRQNSGAASTIGFADAAPPEEAVRLYEAFCEALRELGVNVATGRFGARMVVEIANDGPVTIVLTARVRTD
jgi:hypothetical protein